MKYRNTKTPNRTDALFLALNWFLTAQKDVARIEEYTAAATAPGKRYSIEDIQASAASTYVGRFRTGRLRKKHANDLYWLSQSQNKNRNN